jgi:hypothetical protein
MHDQHGRQLAFRLCGLNQLAAQLAVAARGNFDVFGLDALVRGRDLSSLGRLGF